jgi:hypothetical protein
MITCGDFDLNRLKGNKAMTCKLFVFTGPIGIGCYTIAERIGINLSYMLYDLSKTLEKYLPSHLVEDV